MIIKEILIVTCNKKQLGLQRNKRSLLQKTKTMILVSKKYFIQIFSTSFLFEMKFEIQFSLKCKKEKKVFIQFRNENIYICACEI